MSNGRVENWVLLYRQKVINVLWANCYFLQCFETIQSHQQNAKIWFFIYTIHVYICVCIYIEQIHMCVLHVYCYTSVDNGCTGKYGSDFRVLIASILLSQWNSRSPYALEDDLSILQNWDSVKKMFCLLFESWRRAFKLILRISE